MPENLIEFRHSKGMLGQPYPQPFAASKGIPDRFKRLPPELTVDGQQVDTVKKCPPFVDAMSSGYLIPIIADVEFTMTAQGLEYKSNVPVVDFHDSRQLTGESPQQMSIIKIVSPWIVRTPPGYSCLFTQPLNRFDIPFQALAGVVETDKYYFEINFPMLCLLNPGQSFTLKRGTPIIQVIPFKRDAWTSNCGLADDAERNVWNETGPREGRYKAHYWERKDYE
ncbi:MAG TPA: DUF6065 family protein [Humisphaera sp.]|jgi:hypothetical protein|nr:DUF6065 family protein [Humisphaera sp.]